jgi:hypothetical protein
MSQSTAVLVDGNLVGAVVRQDQGYRFIATDPRAGEIDQTLWPNLEAARRAAEQMVRTGRVDNFTPGTLEE